MIGSTTVWRTIRLLGRIAAARASLRAGRGVRLEDLEVESAAHQGAAPDRGQKRIRPKQAASRRGRGR